MRESTLSASAEGTAADLGSVPDDRDSPRIYVLEFSDGLIKVGFSADVRARIQGLVGVARFGGVSLVRFWVSVPHSNARANEQAALRHCQSVGRRMEGPGKTEFFSGVAFESAVGFATTLTAEPHLSATTNDDYVVRALEVHSEYRRAGVAIDEERITESQIADALGRLEEIARRQLEARADYEPLLDLLVSEDDVEAVREAMYQALFGCPPAEIVAGQEPRLGLAGDWVEHYLTEAQLTLLKSTVLATIAQVELHYPHGARAAEMIDCINRAVRLLGFPRSIAS